MFIWYWVEIILVILLPLIAITQFIIPAIKDKPVLPFFRKTFVKKREVEDTIRGLIVAKEVKDLNKTAHKLKEELDLPEDLKKLRKKALKNKKVGIENV